MRAWVDVLKGRAVVGPRGETIGNVLSVEVDIATWRVLLLRLAVDGVVAATLGIKRGLFSRPTLDIPTERLSATGERLMLAGGHDALVELASAQGELDVAHMQKRFPKPATRPSPEPAPGATAGGAGAAAEE